MIETKVYLIKSDVNTECHCGHPVHEGEEYYMLRTNVPRWIALCVDCVELIGHPRKVCMKELVAMYYETRPIDGRGRERKARDDRKRASFLDAKKKSKSVKEVELMNRAEWI